MSEQVKQTGMSMTTMKVGEMAASSMAAKQKALVEARFVMALQRPRDMQEVRGRILDACKIKDFAEESRYHKPVGKSFGKQVFADGFTIRFAETAIQAMSNIVVDIVTIWEDEVQRTINITVTDLERNITYGRDATLNKTVERKFLKDGQQALSERTNSLGEKVYLVAATEDEMKNKCNAAASFAIRDNGLRLIRKDILVEAEVEIEKTLTTGGGDPQAETKRICDAFRTVGVTPAELANFLGHELNTISKKELAELRSTFTAIRDGESTWQEFVQEDERARDAKPANAEPMPTAKPAPATVRRQKPAPAPAPAPVPEPPAQEAVQPEEDNVPMDDAPPQQEVPPGFRSNLRPETMKPSETPEGVIKGGRQNPPRTQSSTLVEAPISSQDQVENLCLENGFKLDHVRVWAMEMGLAGDEVRAWKKFDDMPGDLAKKCVNAKTGFLKGLSDTAASNRS
jgi:hypothetical protein